MLFREQFCIDGLYKHVMVKLKKIPCNYGDIYKGFFSYVPVECVSFDEAGDDDEQEYEHVDWSEDFVDPGWLLHTKRQESWDEQKGSTSLMEMAALLRYIFYLSSQVQL